LLRKFLIVLLFVPLFVKAQNLGPGAFARMGFYARGMGMGNAMTAVIEGDLVGFYNPAAALFQKKNSINVGYSFLALDRSLNFASFTKRFELGKKFVDSKPRSIAGLSFGVVNSGVSGIEERDAQGIKTGDISTSENLFFLSLSKTFFEDFAAGLTIKFYDYQLYKDVKANALGFDFGLIYKLGENFTLAFNLTDLNAKYRWDTNQLYGLQGRNTEDSFPLGKTVGAAYVVKKVNVLLSGEFASYSSDYNIFRFGCEWGAYENLYLRVGIDEFNVSNFDEPVKPSFGFSYARIVKGWFVGFDYAYVLEPYSPSGIHVIGLNIKI